MSGARRQPLCSRGRAQDLAPPVPQPRSSTRWSCPWPYTLKTRSTRYRTGQIVLKPTPAEAWQTGGDSRPVCGRPSGGGRRGRHCGRGDRHGPRGHPGHAGRPRRPSQARCARERAIRRAADDGHVARRPRRRAAPTSRRPVHGGRGAWTAGCRAHDPQHPPLRDALASLGRVARARDVPIAAVLRTLDAVCRPEVGGDATLDWDHFREWAGGVVILRVLPGRRHAVERRRPPLASGTG